MYAPTYSLKTKMMPLCEINRRSVGHIAHQRNCFNELSSLYRVTTTPSHCLNKWSYYLLFKNRMLFYLQKLKSFHPSVKWARFGRNWKMVPEKTCYYPQCNFTINPSLEKKIKSFIWKGKKNIYSLYHGMICAKFGWNWLVGSGKDDL